ncbi:MAG TPA: branched-chain amino acid ABC transporter permease [Microbacteriaceae bacterium]|nr:branched-chain amino acid ABC transporter permease [Microbacteriaceae bacterium]
MSNPATRATPVVRPATGLIPSRVPGSSGGGFFRSRVVQIVGLGLVLILGLALPYLGTNSFTLSLSSTILIAAILASSVNFLVGEGGMASLGHGAIAGAAAYGAGFASKQGWDVGMQVLLALGITLVVSFVYGILSMRTSGIYFLMVTLAVGMLIFGLASKYSTVTNGDTGIANIARPEFLGEYWQYYYFVFGMFVIATAILWVVTRSPFGASLRGIRDSESRMRSLGYSVSWYKVGAFMISGFIAGLAGLLAVWHTHFVSPTSAGVERSIFAIVMVILGGVGTLLGPLIGAAIVVLIENVLSSYVDRWQLVLGLVFILVILFLRAGVAGSIAKLVRRIRGRTTRPPGGSAPPPGAEPAPIRNHTARKETA